MEPEQTANKEQQRAGRRKMRLAIIAILGTLIGVGMVGIVLMSIRSDITLRQTAVTGIVSIISALIGALSVVIKFYFDSDG